MPTRDGLLTLRSHDLLQVDDILMVQVLKKLYLADGCYGEPFLLIVHPNLLQRHQLTGLHILGKIHLQQRQNPLSNSQETFCRLLSRIHVHSSKMRGLYTPVHMCLLQSDQVSGSCVPLHGSHQTVRLQPPRRAVELAIYTSVQAFISVKLGDPKFRRSLCTGKVCRRKSSLSWRQATSV